MSPELPDGYPYEWEADVVLRDGSVARVRPIVPDDADRIRKFHAGQSEESIYLRYFAPIRELSDRDIHRFTHVDYTDRVALVATHRDDIIGIGRYDKIDDRSAEVAFNISDQYQGKGIGSVMLEHLATIALDKGVERFVAETLPQNRKMLNVFKEAGYAVTHRLEDGVVAVSFNITPTEQSKAVRLAREHRAESISIHTLLYPETIAVIGASRRLGSVGGQFLACILESKYTGGVFAVNSEALEVQGLRSYARVTDIPAQVDLAVIAVPAPAVEAVVAECAVAGVKSIIVVTSGFAEAGEAGEIMQERLVDAARFGGMRLLGPASLGIINTAPDVSLNASLAPRSPRRGRLGLFTQSHALGIAVLSHSDRRNLGISIFASAGNRADISGNDFMQFFLDDESTDVIGLYLESFGNPRKFSRIARAVAQSKPVVAVSSGLAAPGTGSGPRSRQTTLPQDAYDAMLNQSGVIRVENAHQFFDVCQLVLHQPLPRGPRVAIVGNSTALGSLTAQLCTRWKLKVEHGPVVLPDDAGATDFATAIEAAMADPAVDSVVACFIPPLVAEDEEVELVVRSAAQRAEKPIVATYLGMRGISEGVDPADAQCARALPVYPLPEYAVRALGTLAEYVAWRDREQGSPIRAEGLDPDRAEALIHEWLKGVSGTKRLKQPERAELLAAYGIELWPHVSVRTKKEAVAAAESLGYPVVLKARSPKLRHHLELGVRLHLTDADDVREAFDGLVAAAGRHTKEGFAVQRMAAPAVTCVVGSTEDPLFGPVVQFSVGGPPTDLFEDVSYRIPPLTDVAAREAIMSLKAAPLLMGHQGSAPADLEALGDLIGRLSIMADNHPELASVRLNPVRARPDGVDVLDAEIVLRSKTERQDSDRRTLV